MNFASLPLHDATLSACHISWEADRCDFLVRLVGGSSHWLIFEGFTALHFLNEKPWGPSCSINTVRQSSPQDFEIELQSGDVLRVKAIQWTFRADVQAAL